MRKISVENAVGETLCHDMTGVSAEGKKCVMFKRGHVVTKEDIPKLLNIGKSHIFAWEPEADEIHEEDAAFALTKAVCGSGVLYDSKPSEGKIQAVAEVDGLFRVNSAAIRAINSVGDYTVACIPGNTRVNKGGLLAGIRIVPLVTKRTNVEKAVALADENFPVFSVLPFRPLKSGVVITGDEVYYGRIQDKFEPVLRQKMQSYGSEILGVTKCPDNVDRILEAIARFKENGAELILLTGGMSVDPDDVTPAAIRACGSTLVTQGVPMQPGNMLTMAYLDNTMLIGVPGASMFSQVTSLDVFLPRIFAGIKITKGDTQACGEGGLCLGCKVCHYPVCFFGRI